MANEEQGLRSSWMCRALANSSSQPGLGGNGARGKAECPAQGEEHAMLCAKSPRSGLLLLLTSAFCHLTLVVDARCELLSLLAATISAIFQANLLLQKAPSQLQPCS